MKECAAVHVQLAATESPVRSQDEVKAEEPVLFIVQDAAADEAEVGDVLFALARIGPPAIAATAEIERNRADVIGVSGKLPKTVETRAKNGPEHAIAGRFRSVMPQAHTKALAVRARRLCQPYRV
jgi:hypothetical protein